MKFRCRGLYGGKVEGIALVSKKPVSFLGDVDPKTGVIVAEDSDVRGESISGKIFIFPCGRGSTVGTYTLLRLKKNNVAPLAIINEVGDAVIAVGAVIAEIVMVDRVESEFFNIVNSGDWVVVNAAESYVELVR